MKIYNRKKFYSGVCCVALGVLNAAVSVDSLSDIKGILLCALLLFMGAGQVLRGCSAKHAREDRLEELDERNRYLELKTKSASFRITQGVSFCLMVALLVGGKVTGEESLIAVAVGLAFAYTVSMFAELFSFMYFESKG